jgi:hypothetical protein
MQCLYHARPPEMRGDVLYPLNLLGEAHPDLYEHERSKYLGREVLLELRIPLLEVLWNDALHLSPFHPHHLAGAWRAAGLSSPAWERDFFRIPLERVDIERTVWFASGALSDDGSRSLPVDDVSRFDPSRYRELTQPPSGYHEHLRSRRDEGWSARPFAYLPHVLVAAPIDVSGVPLVRADSADCGESIYR